MSCRMHQKEGRGSKSKKKRLNGFTLVTRLSHQALSFEVKSKIIVAEETSSLHRHHVFETVVKSYS